MLALVLALAVGQAPHDGVIRLAIGETHRLDAAGAQQVAVGEPSVLDVQVKDAKTVELVGLTPGDTKVAMIKASGDKVTFEVTVESRVLVPNLKDGAKLVLRVGESITFTKDANWKVSAPKSAAAVTDQLPKGLMVRGVEKGEAEVVLRGPKGETRQVMVKVVPNTDARLTDVQLALGQSVTLSLTDLTYANAVDTDVAVATVQRRGVLVVKGLTAGTTLLRLGFSGDVPRTGLNVTVGAGAPDAGAR